VITKTVTKMDTANVSLFFMIFSFSYFVLDKNTLSRLEIR
jgi:hypothetical protein